MSTNPKNVEQTAAKTPSFKSIDRDIRTLSAEMEQENTLVAETQQGRVARVVKIYNGIQPLLSVLSTLAFIPTTWRAALTVFNTALAALSAGAEEVNPDFKAGRDL
jgi:hypothetical protein